MQTGQRPDEQDDTYPCPFCGNTHYLWETCNDRMAELATDRAQYARETAQLRRALARYGSDADDKLARDTQYHEAECYEQDLVEG